MNLRRGKSIEEWGIGNGDFLLIVHFSPKIEGIISPVEKVMKRQVCGASLYCQCDKPLRLKANQILKNQRNPEEQT
jgi:hypothetical protein